MPPPVDLSVLLSRQAWAEELARGLLAGASLSSELAEPDLAQEAWLIAASRSPRAGVSSAGFLAGIARNLRRAAFRSEARRARREALAAQPEALPSAAELVERAELQRLLVEGVLALDEHERTAVLLRYFEGLSAEEIAQRSGVAGATVRSRLHRGLERLRERLEARIDKNDLLAGLCVLARVPAPSALPSGPPPGSDALPWIGGWIGGLLAMKTVTTLAAGCAAILALVVGLLFVDRDRSEATPACAAPAEAPVVGAERVDAPDSLAQAPKEALRDALEAPPEAAVVRASEPAPSPAILPARLSARLVDEHGNALGGVALRRADALLAESGVQGRIEAKLALRASEELVELEFLHPGFARARRHVRASAGMEILLGDVALVPAATVRGRVVDVRGAGLAGVRVIADGLENPRTDPEELRRMGPIEQEGSVVAETAAAGSFELAGVPLGPVRVWSGSADHAWASIGPLELTSAGSSELVIVLATLEDADRIRGRVLTPEGEPVPGARVHTWFVAASYGTGSQLTADAQGSFEILLNQRVAYDLTISDPENRWSEIYRFGVEPGTLDLELRFEPARWIPVRVSDASGAVIEDFTLGLESAGGSNWLRMTPLQKTLEPGLARVRLPNATFRISAQAAGRATARQGPFDPFAPPEALEFELEALPGVRGIVLTSAGEPAAGAEVGLYSLVSDKIRMESDGFRLVTEGWSEHETMTDAEGRFVLYPQPGADGRVTSGLSVLRAEAAGHAPTETEPRAFDAREGVELELRLLRGGAIEGRALMATGVDPTGLLLAFSRGDGDVRTLRLGPDGLYRIEGLTPGPWQVMALEDEQSGNRSGSSSTYYEEGAPPFDAWSCTVVDGETTRHDVDLEWLAPCHLRGRLELGGKRLASGWTAALEEQATPSSSYRWGGDERVLSSVALDAEGRFELVAPRGGLHRLLLRGPESANGRLELSEVLGLEPGDHDWQLTLETGRLEGSGAFGRGTRERFYVYSWQGAFPGRSLKGSQRIVPDADGRFLLPDVPAGAGQIRRNDPPAEGQEFAPWETVSEFDLRPGETLSIVLP